METLSIILFSVISAIVAILLGCVVHLFSVVGKLKAHIQKLDPVSKYKKMGPSLYVKRPQRDTTSISSSFKHFELNRRSTPDDTPTGNPQPEVGTLDRNFFTRHDFSFDEQFRREQNEEGVSGGRRNNNSRGKEDPEAMAAIANLDKILY